MCSAFNSLGFNKENHIILHTGQHYDKNMSENFFREMEIPAPNYNLCIGSGSQASMTAGMLEAIEKILIKESPDKVIVFGDTNSTLAGALAAVKHGIKTYHIEAGLRSFNRTMPEEINRIVADHTCDILFAPTKTAISNLNNEGLAERTIFSADIMVDSLKNHLQKALSLSTVKAKYNLTESYFLLTLHRPYNVDNIKIIFEKLASLNIKIIFPVHPRTLNIIGVNNLSIPKNILMIEPQGYFDFLALQYYSTKILTDSGGIQKEAYILKKPCITLRTEIEWIETIEDGWNILLDYNDIEFSEKINSFNPTRSQTNVFGENVANRIAKKIIF